MRLELHPQEGSIKRKSFCTLGSSPYQKEINPDGGGTLDNWCEAIKTETIIPKWSVLWAAICGCKQVLGTKTLALEMRLKEKSRAGYFGGGGGTNKQTKKPGLATWKQLRGTRV